jgi:hypothetical protein
MIAAGVGVGCENAWLNVYTANRPPLDAYQQLHHTRPMAAGEIAFIAQETGNHWRKIFNVYAKLVFDLIDTQMPTWQIYRDRQLLQQNSGTALWFSSPFNVKNELSPRAAGQPKTIKLISGRQYAESLGLPEMEAIDRDFSINREQALIVVPYFDYRQLSNLKLGTLRSLIHTL